MIRTEDFDRSNCPVAVTLDIIGDRWTLLVIRDIFLGRRRYGEFLQSPETIPTNILADRLKRLVEHQIVEKHAYSERPRRYEYRLTKRGKGLLPVLLAIRDWGNAEFEATSREPSETISTRKK